MLTTEKETEHVLPLTAGLLPTCRVRERLALALAEVAFLRSALRLAERRDREQARLARLLTPDAREVQHAQA